MGQLEDEIAQAVREFATTPAGDYPLPERDLGNSIAEKIDHTLLRPTAMPRDIESTCREAVESYCGAVCVHTVHLPLAAKLLESALTKPICVVGFPSGAVPTSIKTAEARWAVDQGAHEVDMVISIGHLRAKEYAYVTEDIQQVVLAAGKTIPVKVILETGALNRDQIIAGCLLAKKAGAAFVKTSTGFGPGGATIEDVSLMRAVVGEEMGVKASGGIRDWVTAKAMIRAGATRIGTSSSLKILADLGSTRPVGVASA